MAEATVMQLQFGEEVRDTLLLMSISSRLQREVEEVPETLQQLKRQKNGLKREINAVHQEIIQRRRAAELTADLEQHVIELEEERQVIVDLLADLGHDFENERRFHYRNHREISVDFELEARDLRQHRVCRVRNTDEMEMLQSIWMQCSPIINFGNVELELLAGSSQLTVDFLFTANP